jgi:ubiquinone/menaquinone biosynthesis C-methylase UbiE
MTGCHAASRGSGELLCTWARDHHITATGVDISTAFLAAARARAIELDVAQSGTPGPGHRGRL